MLGSASATPSPTHLTGQVMIRGPWARQSDEHLPSRVWFLEPFLEGVSLLSARCLVSLQLPPGPASTSHRPPEPCWLVQTMDSKAAQGSRPVLPAGPLPAGNPTLTGSLWVAADSASRSSWTGRLSAVGGGDPAEEQPHTLPPWRGQRANGGPAGDTSESLKSAPVTSFPNRI